jgi:hypothetical protein
MSAGVLKSYHPCFFVCVDFGCAYGDFQLHGGPFCPFGSDDIFFAPHDGLSALPNDGSQHSNMPGLSSTFCRCRIVNHTIDIG